MYVYAPNVDKTSYAYMLLLFQTPVKGKWVFGKGDGEEKTYQALMPLLRAKSPKFNELVDNEVRLWYSVHIYSMFLNDM